MSPRFSLVYPTRHRPEFIRQALRILERQEHDSFEVVISDNFEDAARSCERTSRESSVANVRYVRPPKPVGMVENWNYALQFATGDYICYLTDKMLLLPGALRRLDSALEAAGGADIVSWTTDEYHPESFTDYFGSGRYFGEPVRPRAVAYRRYSSRAELDRRGRAEVARGEQSRADYCRGKLVFGTYRRDLIDRIRERYGALFHNISPDYTSMILGLSEGRDAIEVEASLVVSINTDLSNGNLSEVNDAASLGYITSLTSGQEDILPNLLVPGLYASQHSVVAHDFLALRRAFDLGFEFSIENWLVYCTEDIYRPDRRWSDPRVEKEQKGLLETFIESLGPAVGARMRARVAKRAALKSSRRIARRALRTIVPSRLVPSEAIVAPSLEAAVTQRTADVTRA